jgi:hypothetical protein
MPPLQQPQVYHVEPVVIANMFDGCVKFVSEGLI